MIRLVVSGIMGNVSSNFPTNLRWIAGLSALMPTTVAPTASNCDFFSWKSFAS